jgi:hypothetical protein
MTDSPNGNSAGPDEIRHRWLSRKRLLIALPIALLVLGLFAAFPGYKL